MKTALPSLLHRIWPRLRDALAVLLAAGILGVLGHAWLAGPTREDRVRLETVESTLQELQKQSPASPAAARQRLKAVEASLAELQQPNPAAVPLQSRHAMQRWLEQNAAQHPRETILLTRRALALLTALSLALLCVAVSLWFPSRA